uniref:Uncharacterized protein n=1 Tax=Rhizophora mucronata TaxID=61149 RepID=A0A2P2LKJ8_RHIMU
MYIYDFVCFDEINYLQSVSTS